MRLVSTADHRVLPTRAREAVLPSLREDRLILAVAWVATSVVQESCVGWVCQEVGAQSFRGVPGHSHVKLSKQTRLAGDRVEEEAPIWEYALLTSHHCLVADIKTV